MLRKAEHIGIMVSDLDRSIKFYTEVLGLKLRERIDSPQTGWAFLTVGDTEIELIWKKGADFNYADQGIVNHLAFTVDDVGAALEHLRRHGVELINEEPVYAAPLRARLAFFRGPDGERLEIFRGNVDE